MGRNTRGVKGINLSAEDEVVGMVVADPEGYLLTLCENGYGKRTPFGANEPEAAATPDDEPEASATPDDEPEASATPDDEPEASATGDEEAEGEQRSSMQYRKQRRGGKGVRDVRITDKNGPVVGVVAVRDTDDIMLITAGGMVNRTHVSEIRVVGRNTQGVKVMGLNEGDKLVSLAKVAREEDEGPAETAGEEATNVD